MITPPITALSAKTPPNIGTPPGVGKPVKMAPPHQSHQAHIIAVGNAIARLKAAKKPISADLAHQNHLIQNEGRENQLNKYLTNDTTYQSQMTAIQKAIGDYGANELQQENSYNSGYALNKSHLDEQKRTTGIDQMEDFGSRGMVRSGLYGVANTDRLNDFANQYSQLDQGRSDYLMNLRQGLGNFNTSQGLAQQQARQDAINRRAIGLIGGTPGVR